MGVTLSRRTRRSRVGHIQIGKRRCVPQSKSLGRKSLQLQVFPAEISTCGLQAAESRLAAKVSALVLPKAPRAWLPRMNCATKNKNRNSKNHSGGKSAAFSKGGKKGGGKGSKGGKGGKKGGGKAGNGATASAGKASAPGHGKNGAFKSKSKPTLAASKKTKGTKGKKNSASKGKKK